MMKHLQIFPLFLMFLLCTSLKGQNKADLPKDNLRSEAIELITSQGTRNIIQDRNGNIWLASFTGIIKYNGKTFTNINNKVTKSRFISALEDRNGNFWFASIGSGVYYYDGKSFQNFTTNEGLANDRVTNIYEDKSGNIWFGTEGGASRYDGKSFQNFTIEDGLSHSDVSTIIEDTTGKFWFGTRGGVNIYDGKQFTIFKKYGLPFKNVRSIIEDKKGNMWFGGEDGLWRYNDRTFTNLTEMFVGYIYEDKSGNIWISSESTGGYGWSLSRRDGSYLYCNVGISPLLSQVTTEVITLEEEMIFGILEAHDGSIWFGTTQGVYRYGN